MRKISNYLNPIKRLGDSRYSFFFPFIANVLLIVVSETFAYIIAKDPLIVGAYIIFLNAAFIIYFAFRDGIRGGVISTIGAVSYYFYIIYSRNYQGDQLRSGIEATLMFALVYTLLALIVGWLKQTIDKLIQREADEKKRLSAIIEQLPEGVLITDKNGKLVQRNKRLDSILGVKMPIGFMVGKDTLEKARINDGPIDPSKSPLFNALKTGKSVIGVDISYQRKDKKRLELQVSAAPVFNSKKTIIAAVSIITDVTKLRELERSKDEFLGIASHELKTPVTSIKAYAQVLKAKFAKQGDEKSVEYLQKLDSQIDKLTNLIKDLLDVTKIQSGKLEHKRDHFDVNELVDEIISEISLTTKHRIIKNLDRTQTVYASRDKVGQVLTNLLSNAIKYSPVSKKINVTTVNKRRDIVFSVEDYGVGVPKEDQSKIFGQFYRAKGNNSNTYPGLGLGLFISSQIVKSEGGKMWVESRTGKGSKFFFSLPVSSSNAN